VRFFLLALTLSACGFPLDDFHPGDASDTGLDGMTTESASDSNASIDGDGPTATKTKADADAAHDADAAVHDAVAHTDADTTPDIIATTDSPTIVDTNNPADVLPTTEVDATDFSTCEQNCTVSNPSSVAAFCLVCWSDVTQYCTTCPSMAIQIDSISPDCATCIRTNAYVQACVTTNSAQAYTTCLGTCQ
jgi:hypothetical protein